MIIAAMTLPLPPSFRTPPCPLMVKIVEVDMMMTVIMEKWGLRVIALSLRKIHS